MTMWLELIVQSIALGVALAMDAQDLAIDSLERVFELNRDNEKIIWTS